MDIANVLNVDPNILLGRKTIDYVYNEALPKDPLDSIADSFEELFTKD